MFGSVVYRSRRVRWREAMAAMRYLKMRIGRMPRGEETDLVLCTFGIEHGDEHVTVAVAPGPVCAEDLSEAGRGWLREKMRGRLGEGGRYRPARGPARWRRGVSCGRGRECGSALRGNSSLKDAVRAQTFCRTAKSNILSLSSKFRTPSQREAEIPETKKYQNSFPSSSHP